MHEGLIVVDRTDRIAIYNRRALQLLDLPESFHRHPPSSAKDVIAYQAERGGFESAPDTIKPRMLPHPTGETANVQERERPNGTVLEIRTVPFSHGGVVRTYKDVTGWRRIERELGERERLFRLLAENATDIIARLDFEGTLLYVSPSCHSVLGYTAEEMLGTKVADYIFPDDVKPTARYYGQLAKGTPRDQRRVEYRARHKDGHWLWLEASPRLVVDDAGKPVEFVDVVRETTERKAIELDAAAAKERAESAAAAQAQFLATMSHELRTPLNSIVGFVDVILNRTDLAWDARRQIGLVQTASEVLLMIVNDVLDFTRIEEGKLELKMVEFDLVRLIESSFKIVLDSAVAKNLDVRISVDDRIASRLVGDEHRLRQILLNLLNNAIKFTHQGSVSLTVELAGQGTTGEELRFSIKDTGIGIAEGKIGQLFQRFSQVDGSTRREYGGSGLGLAISKRLVEMMGGEIGVDSIPGTGSTFWVLLTLPRAEEPTHSPNDAAVPAAPASARLLLVEDVEINREIACAILRSIGYRVDAVSSGFEAIVAVQSSRYDLVLMDIQMPGMDGLTATRQIRALPGDVANIPIVALTANVLPKQIESFRSAGINDHIGKPFKRDELRATIERCLSKPDSEPVSGAIESAVPAAIDDEAFAMLSALMERAQLDSLLGELKVELESFVSADAASPDLARQAHRLVSAAGLLGFGDVSKCCSDLEAALSGHGRITFEEVREVCLSALSEISARFSPAEEPSGKAAALGRAFSSEVETGSRQENALKLKIQGPVSIQSNTALVRGRIGGRRVGRLWPAICVAGCTGGGDGRTYLAIGGFEHHRRHRAAHRAVGRWADCNGPSLRGRAAGAARRQSMAPAARCGRHSAPLFEWRHARSGRSASRAAPCAHPYPRL